MAKEDIKKSKPGSGVGLDVGTMNFVAARRSGQKAETRRVRDAFLDLDPSHRRMLKLGHKSFVELEGRLLVIGDEALECANLLNREARRPMAGGLLNPSEVDAQQVVAIMVKEILGSPVVPGEKCCYSVPAPAIDVSGSDVTYHRRVLAKVLEELGYSAEACNEAQAVVLSECMQENFCGIGISYGSGMTNVALVFNGMSALEFSVGKGGDWVDSGASGAVGLTKAKMTALKESGVDIARPQGREQEAIAFFLDELIEQSIRGLIAQFHRAKSDILVPRPIPVIVSGGTSLAKGFLDKFRIQFDKLRGKLPLEVSEIRPAQDPMTAVATGLLLMSSMDD